MDNLKFSVWEFTRFVGFFKRSDEVILNHTILPPRRLLAGMRQIDDNFVSS